MESYVVRLLEPESRELLLERVTLGDTSYHVKKKFFQEVIELHPQLKGVGLSCVLPYLSLRRLDKGGWSGKGGPLGRLFGELRIWQKVTRLSIEGGLIPKICPICGNPPIVDDERFLVIHH